MYFTLDILKFSAPIKGTEKQKYLNAYIRLCIYKSTKNGGSGETLQMPNGCNVAPPSCRRSFHPIASPDDCGQFSR